MTEKPKSESYLRYLKVKEREEREHMRRIEKELAILRKQFVNYSGKNT